MDDELTRRELLRAGTVAGAALCAGSLLPRSVVAEALAGPRCGGLDDIEHVVILIQENRSFDHYFGTYPGVAGFADRGVLSLTDGSGLSIFAQPGYPRGYEGDHLHPFHLDSFDKGECTNDIDHSWGCQHVCWHGGRLDRFVRAHIAVDGYLNGPLTMGYYSRPDLDFYYALADAFTICDHYHCSVIGPTDPNRLYAMSGTLDPTGEHGGPILSTSATRVQRYGTLTWTTMPERLQAEGISWRLYGDPRGNYGANVLPYFKSFHTDPVLAANGLAPTFPGTFEGDVSAGRLPQVSWILAPVFSSEHPPAPIEYGQVVAARTLNALVSNPAVWARTALFITHDENGGFFDHVPPPTAPPGTAGEHLTVSPLRSEAAGAAGPVGLGFRVPMLVVSPFSRGGLVCSETFDHTSLLRFIETRFGVEVPNLSPWRRSATGDLTSAFSFADRDMSMPSLPKPSLADLRVTMTGPAAGAPWSFFANSGSSIEALERTSVAPYPVTVNSAPPGQEPGRRRRPSAPERCTRGRA
jgi:phospholipase C